MCREITFHEPAQVTILSDRRKFGPYGLVGGEPGQPGRNLLKREDDIQEMPSKCRMDVQPGDLLTIESPGGGGYGRLPH